MRRTGTSIFLPVRVYGMALHLEDPVGHVPRRVLVADLGTDPRLDVLVERLVALELDEQRHEELPARQVEIHDQRVLDLGHAQQRAIDLGGADAHAMAVQRGVRAAQHEAAAARIHAEEIAVPPHAGPLVEVRLAVAAAVLVAPEADGHRRQRFGEHQFADLVDHGSGPVR